MTQAHILVLESVLLFKGRFTWFLFSFMWKRLANRGSLPVILTGAEADQQPGSIQG